MQDTDIYLVRHGQAQCNLDRIITCQTESALTDVGRSETQRLKEKLGHVHFDKVISSDLSRAVETAKVLADTDAAIQQFPELRERAFGALEGQPDSVLKCFLRLMPNWRHSNSGERHWAKILKAISRFIAELCRVLKRLSKIMVDP